jgi:hypothetical protein
MYFGLDFDASMILGISILVIAFNTLFVGTVFVYLCCCIDLVKSNKNHYKNKKTIYATHDFEQTIDNIEHEEHRPMSNFEKKFNESLYDKLQYLNEQDMAGF